MLEALACGTPVLISKTQALVEVASDAAAIANPKDPKDIADKISKLVKSPTTRALLAKKGKERVERYSWDKTAKETAQLYRKVLGK